MRNGMNYTRLSLLFFAILVGCSQAHSRDDYSLEAQQGEGGDSGSDAKFSLATVLGKNFVARSEWSTSVPNYEKLLEAKKIEKDKAKELVTLHHTVTGHKALFNGVIPKGQEINLVRVIEHYHMNTNKWSDLGYHGIIAPSGNFYEGRKLDIVGSHTKGLNRKNAGLAFLGCYDDEGCAKEGYKVTEVTDEMIDSATRFVAFLAFNEGFEITKESVMPRNLYEKSRNKGETGFPYSPGNRIIERLDEIINGAKKLVKSWKKDGPSAKPLRVLS